ncbi:hypothetical protein [Curtobacterium sp. MCSS17_007]|uniref:hypothetical protein n=1 Tax=Curtobacterium sp. MCSS17_007 TaxID=2175646 RepID=UPI000DA9A454|nr:hypothetical protein [Curtobacterium sp. MCSS17_007]WIE74499.1 hypothetical protein DEJ22_009410 [Curtobacterium sp. MCSS17_007]
MTTFDMADWGRRKPDEGLSTEQAVMAFFPLASDLNSGTVLNYFPAQPALHHLQLSMDTIDGGNPVACFDEELIRRAWEFGLWTQLVPADESYLVESTIYALEDLNLGRGPYPEERIVRYRRES